MGHVLLALPVLQAALLLHAARLHAALLRRAARHAVGLFLVCQLDAVLADHADLVDHADHADHVDHAHLNVLLVLLALHHVALLHVAQDFRKCSKGDVKLCYVSRTRTLYVWL